MKWYTEVLGLQYFRGQEQHNAYTAKLVGFDGAHLKVAQLHVPGQPFAEQANHHIELVEYIHPAGKDDIDLATYHNGNGHWAFIVDDIHSEFARMKALGVHFKAGAPVAIEQGVNKGGFAIYFTDCNGITLELLQPPPKPSRAPTPDLAAGYQALAAEEAANAEKASFE